MTAVAAEGGNPNTKRIDNNTVKRNEDVNSHRRHYLPRIKIKDYNTLIAGRNFFY